MINDMGITSPLRPVEPPNPDGLTDDDKPGIDATLDMVNELATYMRTTAIPTRGMLTAQGAVLFDQALCSVCHAPSLKTRSDYPIAQLAGIDAPIFTDLLVHDSGAAFADGMTDGEATGREYRTPALIGVRYQKAFMNDGRAHSVLEAIQLHGGEGAGSAQAFANLSASDQQTLVAYVQAL
jgi:CxxC motif-containing protein (DUF1111 family)